MSNTSNTSKAQSSHESQAADEPEEPEEARESAEDRPSPMQVLRHARSQLAELTGMAPESVSSFEQTGDGWTLEVEVLEIARVPDTMSLLASYRVELDPQGELTGYRRVRRYERGRADPHRR
ncbi:gas vesicle protein GvpO [Streptomyces europaeiscabiei]|uniref:Gas vesicle protein n=1 Tax=Streptomyces europaeiscabiei TaxID=146819 RepID=A0ABU4N5N9_9ACTN|nr:gas vesicle protein [Streptomyces europaeiscabiei]MDX2526975.1 gas vesicle protein [Streptomyces europaeiscabiei]MDX2758539.1 gas vesicle protein [Streptomyces europaeiscabiei]MDX3542042.1 gas vesicle protein [Streptomyces europaeiscabiei]MDX3551090.1 gas vesicle protein [Streptomyces europaeiscabiei]MDX3698350.1 gas vesicle protein [Streptomyces europaeiscabiei]